MSASLPCFRPVVLPAFVVAAFVLRCAAGSPEFEQHMVAKHWVEAEQIAAARLKDEPASAEAAADMGRVILASNQKARFEEAIGLLAKALEKEPKRADFSFYLGQLHGRVASSSGIGGLGAARRSRAALERAVELEPGNFEYVFALNEFYLEAPGIAGGSVRRARAAAEAYRKVDADGAVILGAQVAVAEGHAADAAKALLELSRRNDNLLDVCRRMVLVGAGLALVDAGKAHDALPAFEQVTKEFPSNAAGQRGYGRALLASGDAAAAIPVLMRAKEIDGHVDAWYWLGVAYQEHGDKEEARAALETSIERRNSGRIADEARRRLAALGD